MLFRSKNILFLLAQIHASIRELKKRKFAQHQESVRPQPTSEEAAVRPVQKRERERVLAEL